MLPTWLALLLVCGPPLAFFFCCCEVCLDCGCANEEGTPDQYQIDVPEPFWTTPVACDPMTGLGTRCEDNTDCNTDFPASHTLDRDDEVEQFSNPTFGNVCKWRSPLIEDLCAGQAFSEVVPCLAVGSPSTNTVFFQVERFCDVDEVDPFTGPYQRVYMVIYKGTHANFAAALAANEYLVYLWRFADDDAASDCATEWEDGVDSDSVELYNDIGLGTFTPCAMADADPITLTAIYA